MLNTNQNHPIHKSNIQILSTLLSHNYTTPFKSATIAQLISIPNNPLPFSSSKVSKDLNALTTASLTSRGIKKSRAETFYITQQGIDYLNQIFKEVLSNAE